MESRRDLMIDKSIVFVIGAYLFMSASILAGSEGTEKETVTGTVVAYDIGVELANGSCRQTIIVRTKNRGDNSRGGEYVIVRYEDPGKKVIPELILKKTRQWRFSLNREVKCDQALEDLLYITNPTPVGSSRIRVLKLVTDAGGEKIPKDVTLACYVVKAGEFEPPLKERRIAGVVVWADGRPAGGVHVLLRNGGDQKSYLWVNADVHGRFEIPVYEGLTYAVQTNTVVGTRTILGKLIKIPAEGEIKPLRLVIK